MLSLQDLLLRLPYSQLHMCFLLSGRNMLSLVLDVPLIQGIGMERILNRIVFENLALAK